MEVFSKSRTAYLVTVHNGIHQNSKAADSHNAVRRISLWFSTSCLLDNSISSKERPTGLTDLPNELLAEILNPVIDHAVENATWPSPAKYAVNRKIYAAAIDAFFATRQLHTTFSAQLCQVWKSQYHKVAMQVKYGTSSDTFVKRKIFFNRTASLQLTITKHSNHYAMEMLADEVGVLIAKSKALRFLTVQMDLVEARWVAWWWRKVRIRVERKSGGEFKGLEVRMEGDLIEPVIVTI